MEIPAALYGTQKEVAVRVRAMVKEIRAGASLDIAAGAERIDPSTTGAMIVLQGRSRLISQVPVIHIYEPLYEIGLANLEGRLPNEVMERVFEEALVLPWGLLSLIARANNYWFYSEAHHRPFWTQVLNWWNVFDAVGRHYTFGGSQTKDLWSVPNNVHYVAIHLGVPEEVVQRPLPPAGLVALAPMVR
ncbi:MAG TPA: hypothetical protein VHO06_27990 [Polyangia bacterium]|nr:hypothetical protein [Polyangia bacterium]